MPLQLTNALPFPTHTRYHHVRASPLLPRRLLLYLGLGRQEGQMAGLAPRSTSRLSKTAFLEAYPAYGYRSSSTTSSSTTSSSSPSTFNIENDAAPSDTPNASRNDDSSPTGSQGVGTAAAVDIHGPQSSTPPVPPPPPDLLPIDKLRQDDFPALYHPRHNPQGVVYLDHAGATLYARSQLARCHARLQDNLFGNPHSQGPVAGATADSVEEARALVLEHFHASPEEWTVVFTSGATASLKLAAELMPWRQQAGSRLIYAHNSHTSVLGMREVALEAGADFACLPPSVQYGEDSDNALSIALQELLEQAAVDDKENDAADTDCDSCPTEHLLVLPAECNFSGRKLDLAALQRATSRLRASAPQHRVTVLLDAAKHAGTSPLDLSRFQEGEVDMACVSFYKLFGYPTGLGCLMLRSSVARRLLQFSSSQGASEESTTLPPSLSPSHRAAGRPPRRRYFGGGTVLAAVPQADFRLLRPEPAQCLADGTEDYLGIMALKEGFRALRELGGGGMDSIQAHTWTLTHFCHDQLTGLRHANGQPVCEMYSPRPLSPERQGAVLAFNVRRADGAIVGYTEVEKLAALHGIQLRTGCFCNPGACQEALGLTLDEVQAQLAAGHVCWDENDLVEGRPTGAVRVSMGYMSTWEDVTALLHVLDKYFVSKTTMTAVVAAAATFVPSLSLSMPSPSCSEASATPALLTSQLRLGGILLYPIKSCGAMSVTVWPIGPTGLLFDREWALVDGQGQALRLNKMPQMRFIKPRVDLERQELVVSAPNMPDLVLSLRLVPASEQLRDVSVCGEACQGLGYQDAEGVDTWFSTFLKRACSLVRACPYAQKRKPRRAAGAAAAAVVAEGMAEEEGKEQEKEGREEISFTNEAQFLLVSSASVAHLNELIAQQVDLEYAFCFEGARSDRCYVTLENFRPNLVVDGGMAHQEDLWERVELLVEGEEQAQDGAEAGAGKGGERGIGLQVTGPCARCSMVNIDHRVATATAGKGGEGGGGTGERGSSAASAAHVAPVLKTLASYRRDMSSIYFGQFLAFDDLVGGHHEGWLRIGAIVQARRRSGITE